MTEIKINREYTKAWVDSIEIQGHNKIGRVLTGDLVKINSLGQVELVTARRTPIVGCLKLNSTQSFSPNQRGVPRYNFLPLSANYPSFLVASNLKRSQGDVYIIIEFQSWNQTSARPDGRIVQVLGPVGDYTTEILTRLHYRSVYFPKFKMNKHINPSHLAVQLNEAIMNSGFPDRSDLEVYSIDPEGCLDIDDAFSVQLVESTECVGDGTGSVKNTKQLIKLGIHIADVNFFLEILNIDINQLIDRPTSVYLPESVRHMLPEFLGTDWASLHVGQVRPTLTIWWLIDAETGQILTENVERILIRNRKAFSYEAVSRTSNPTMNLVYEVSQKLAKIYLQSTSVEWDSHDVIETLMIMSNYRVAKILATKTNICPIYRTHETNPDLDPQTHTHLECPAHLTKVVQQIKMESANYVRTSGRHYGLNLETYTHFTSPIRRLVDVLVHRSLLDLPTPEIDLSVINQFNQRVKRLERDVSWLQLVENIRNQESMMVEAYFLGYNSQTQRISLYLELAETETKLKIIEYRLIPEALAHLFEISFVNETLLLRRLNTGFASENYYDHQFTVELKLYQKMTLILYAHPKETELQNKLGVEIECLKDFFKLDQAS